MDCGPTKTVDKLSTQTDRQAADQFIRVTRRIDYYYFVFTLRCLFSPLLRAAGKAIGPTGR